MTRLTISWCAAVALLLTLSQRSAQAQELPDIITDRPDFTESPTTVPVGRVQIEAGATQEWGRDSDVIAGPEALIRWSPLSRFELRLTLPDYIDAGSASGFGDISVGAKAAFGTLGGWQVAGLAGLSLPTGENEVSSGEVVPEVLLTAGRDLSTSWSLGAQVSATLVNAANDVELGATLVMGTSLTERIGTFLEAAVSGPVGEPVAALLHHGYTLSLGSQMQADLHAGVGLTDTAPKFLLGAGWSTRF